MKVKLGGLWIVGQNLNLWKRKSTRDLNRDTKINHIERGQFRGFLQLREFEFNCAANGMAVGANYSVINRVSARLKTLLKNRCGNS